MYSSWKKATIVEPFSGARVGASSLRWPSSGRPVGLVDETVVFSTLTLLVLVSLSQFCVCSESICSLDCLLIALACLPLVRVLENTQPIHWSRSCWPILVMLTRNVGTSSRRSWRERRWSTTEAEPAVVTADVVSTLLAKAVTYFFFLFHRRAWNIMNYASVLAPSWSMSSIRYVTCRFADVSDHCACQNNHTSVNEFPWWHVTQLFCWALVFVVSSLDKNRPVPGGALNVQWCTYWEPPCLIGNYRPFLIWGSWCERSWKMETVRRVVEAPNQWQDPAAFATQRWQPSLFAMRLHAVATRPRGAWEHGLRSWWVVWA